MLKLSHGHLTSNRNACTCTHTKTISLVTASIFYSISRPHTCTVKQQNTEKGKINNKSTVSRVLFQECSEYFHPPRFVPHWAIDFPYLQHGDHPPPFESSTRLLPPLEQYTQWWVTNIPLRALVDRAASWEGHLGLTPSEQTNCWRRGSLDKGRPQGYSSTPDKSWRSPSPPPPISAPWSATPRKKQWMQNAYIMLKWRETVPSRALCVPNMAFNARHNWLAINLRV